MNKKKIIITRANKKLPDEYIQRMSEIVAHYFPDEEIVRDIVQKHLAQADSVRLAWYKQKIIGFAVASKAKEKTPFYPLKINVLFQRMLFLEPDTLYRGLGLRLLAGVMRDLLGLLWPIRRFAVVCRTQNPVVVKMMDMFNESYPGTNFEMPASIREYCQKMLPRLGATDLDDKYRLLGTLEPFKDMDYTQIWNNYIHRRNSKYEEMMLESAFRHENGKVINSGAFVLLISYSKPFRFIHYLFHK